MTRKTSANDNKKVINAVKYNLTKLTTNRHWYLSGRHWWRVLAHAQSTSLELRAVCLSVQCSVADFLWSFDSVLSSPFCPFPPYPPFPLLTQHDGCLDVSGWGLLVKLWECFCCLAAGWSQCRPLDIPGTHSP